MHGCPHETLLMQVVQTNEDLFDKWYFIDFSMYRKC